MLCLQLRGVILDNIQIHILINIHSIQLTRVLRQLDQLVYMASIVVRAKMPLVLSQDLGLSLLASQAVAEGRLDDFFLEDGAVLERDGEGVGDGALLRVVVVLGELWVLDAADALAEGLDELGGGGFAVVGVVGGFEAVEDEHG